MLLAKAVASQYGPRGIRGNAVAPGLVLTPAVAEMTPEQLETSNMLYPMPRLCTPEDVAKAVLFLASDEAAYVNGTTPMVEGGATIFRRAVRTAHLGDELSCRDPQARRDMAGQRSDLTKPDNGSQFERHTRRARMPSAPSDR